MDGHRQPGRGAVIWTVAAFVAAALPHLAAMPWTLVVLTLGGPAWRLLALYRRWRPPPTVLRVLFTLAAVALVFISHGLLWGRRVAASLLCVMLAAKMLELFRRRDLRLVASVSFFLIATQFLFNERLIYLPYLIGGCWLACMALLQIQRDEDNAVAQPWPSQLLRAGTLLALAAPLALALFVLFPRLAQPLWGLPDNVMDGRSGLSDSMSPGSISSLYMDDTPAFRVTFDGDLPPPQERYWRGPILWNFDGTTWGRHFLAQSPATALPSVAGARYRYQVQLEPHEQRWLFTLDYPASWSEDAVLTLDYQLISKRPVTSLTAYRVASDPDFVDSPELQATMRRAALALPQGRNPRTVALAAQWRDEFPDDRELIAYILGWLNTEPFFYSLETLPLGYHGADEFLFDLREGYCEYYASAFAILMRAAGIPARIATGYQGGYWQSAAGYMLVRNSDAHAWVEVWLPGSGWTRVDPTAAVAPARIRDGSRAVAPSRGALDWEWLRALRNRYDRVQHWWNQWILGYDAASQRLLLGRLGFESPSATQLAMLMLAVVGSILAVLLWIMWRHPAVARQSDALRTWRRLLRRLRRRGLRPQPAETPLEFAARADRRLPAGGDQLVKLALMFCRLHYGQGSATLQRRFEAAVDHYRPG